MIKRLAALSVMNGGKVKEVIARDGTPYKITTYCRFFQKQPCKRGMLCHGFMHYPACPDLTVCQEKKVKQPTYNISKLRIKESSPVEEEIHLSLLL